MKRRLAPACYRHIGGLLGEALLTQLYNLGWLVGAEADPPQITPVGREGFEELGVPLAELNTKRRKPINFCTERHGGIHFEHLGAHLSELLTVRLVELGWLRRPGEGPGSEYLVTDAGRAGLARLGINVKELESRVEVGT